MSQNQPAFIAGMKQMLQSHGFEDVDVQSAPLPQNIIDAFDDLRDAVRFEYYCVTTKQGNFGIMSLPGDPDHLLDFTGTGISMNELYPDYILEQLPDNFPSVIPLEDSEQLLLLWQLLTKKKAQP